MHFPAHQPYQTWQCAAIQRRLKPLLQPGNRSQAALWRGEKTTLASPVGMTWFDGTNDSINAAAGVTLIWLNEAEIKRYLAWRKLRGSRMTGSDIT